MCCLYGADANLNTAQTTLQLLEHTDAWRRPQRFEEFLLACEADARGRLGLEHRDYPQTDYLRTALARAQSVSAAQFTDRGLAGKQLGEAINAERIKQLDELRVSQ